MIRTDKPFRALKKLLIYNILVLLLTQIDVAIADNQSYTSIYKRLGITICDMREDPELPKDSDALFEKAKLCEGLLDQNLKDLLAQTRDCLHRVVQALEVTGSRDELVSNIILESRTCANEVDVLWRGSPTPTYGPQKAIWEFLPKLYSYFAVISDEFLIIDKFNEAVKRNDIRIISSLVNSLLTEDAKKLIPSGLTTALLVSQYNKLSDESISRLNHNEDNLSKAKKALTLKTYIIF